MILFFGSCIGRAITDESNAAEAVRNMDILNIPAKELHISAFENDTFSDDSTVGEAIAAMTVGSGVDESNIRRIYERSTVKEFIGNTAAEYAEYIRSGEKPEEVTPEKVKSLLGENISVIFVNNGIYGMTGGQLAPTTLVGMKATTAPKGRDPKEHGYPMHVCEVLNQLTAPYYLERTSCNNPANVNKTKAAIRKAFQNQLDGKGFSPVEIVTSCPTNWGLEPLEALGFLEEKMFAEFPLGVIRDKDKEGV